MTVASTKPADLVLSGGGVKGVGLVGAVVALMDAYERGYAATRQFLSPWDRSDFLRRFRRL